MTVAYEMPIDGKGSQSLLRKSGARSLIEKLRRLLDVEEEIPRGRMADRRSGRYQLIVASET
jgi:hypothetical protein